MRLFRSVVFDIRSVECFIRSVSCRRDFFDQLCSILDQLGVLFNQSYMWLFRSVVFDIRSVECFIRSVVDVTFSIIPSVVFRSFNQLYMWHFRSVVFDISWVFYSISCRCDFFDHSISCVSIIESVVHVTFSISCV